MIRLATESLGLWRDWEREFGVGLVSRDGVLAIGQDAAQIRNRLELAFPGEGCRELTGDGPGRMLPLLGDARVPAVVDPAGGVIWARAAVGNLFARLDRNVIPCRVEGVDVLDDGRALVRAGEIERTYDAVVVAAGAATGKLAGRLGLKIPLERRVRIWVTHDIRPDLAGRPVPGFRWTGKDGEIASGYPVSGYRRYTVTFHREPGPDPVSPAGTEAVDRSADGIGDWIRENLPGLGPGGGEVRSCWGAQLPWGADGLAVWRLGPCLVPAGTQMFRLAPLLGEVLADAAEGAPVRKGFRPEDRAGAPRAA